MKNSKLMLVGVFLTGLTIPSFAQIGLPEVSIVALNYKYLNSVDDQHSASHIRALQREAAVFDLKNSEYYNNKFDTYHISFYVPQGKILAAYDKNGKLMRSSEKFKNSKLPRTVLQTVGNNYPDWKISKDIYMVRYFDKKGSMKTYKLLLQKENRKMRIKLNHQGEIV